MKPWVRQAVCFAIGVSLPIFVGADSSNAQSALTIDKLERQGIAKAAKEVGFSSLLEGTVSDPDLVVFILVRQAQSKGWRVFPATTERSPESKGRYRWRAICHFGDLDGRGVGAEYQVKAIAFEPAALAQGLSLKRSQGAPTTEPVILKRAK